MRINLALGTLAALQLLTSLVGQLMVLRLVGIGAATDAYIAAQAVPTVLSAAIVASLQSLWLPRFVRVAKDAVALGAEQSIAQGQALLVLVGISLPLWIASPWWVRWLFPGFTEVQSADVVLLGGPLLLAGVLNAQSSLLTVGLRACGRFIRGEVAVLAGSVMAIALIAIFVPRYGVLGASVIAVVRAAAIYGIHLMQAGRPGINLKPVASGHESWRQVRTLIGASLIIKTTPIVDRYWSSQAPAGAVTTLNIAQLAMNSLGTVLERAVLVPTSPEFARLLQQRDLRGLAKAYHRCLLRLATAVGGIGLVLVLLHPAWNVALWWALKVPADNARTIYWACLLLLPSVFCSVSAAAATAVFYAFGETRTPTLIGIGGFLASLVMKAILFREFGILGIAAGASLYLILLLAMYHAAVRRRVRRAEREALPPV